MAQKLGYRIRTKITRAPKEVIEKIKGYTTGNIVDAMGRMTGAMNYMIKPVAPGMKMIGTAMTMSVRPCDNLVVYKALDMAEEGDVFVLTNGGLRSNATWGDLTSMIGVAKKMAGVVTDGLARDIEGIAEVGLPVFAAGCIPNGGFKDGPGEINFPISCGGVAVNPGDIIVGDTDGVVVIPKEIAEDVAAELPKIIEKEKKTISNINAGRLIPDWVGPKLKEVGFEIVDE